MGYTHALLELEQTAIDTAGTTPAEPRPRRTPRRVKRQPLRRMEGGTRVARAARLCSVTCRASLSTRDCREMRDEDGLAAMVFVGAASPRGPSADVVPRQGRIALAVLPDENTDRLGVYEAVPGGP